MKRALEFLRLLDEQGNLSLTNLAVIAFIANAVYHGASTTDLVGVGMALLTYAHKRQVGLGNGEAAAQIQQALDAVEMLRTEMRSLERKTRDTAAAFSSTAARPDHP